jgi:uncharacterized protein (DUF2267 family)
MTDTGFHAFSTTIEKTNQVLKEIEQAYGWSKDQRQLSYDALRVVLHALRDRLRVEEAADLGAQLPLLVRGLYYENWRPAHVPVKMNRQEFVDRIGEEFPRDVEGGAEVLAVRVLGAIRRYISDGEWDDVRSTMPKDLLTLLPA